MASGDSSNQILTDETNEYVITELAQCPGLIPDPVTAHYLKQVGCETSDKRMVRLISLAAQKFVYDLANDALQNCKMKGGAVGKDNSKEQRYVMKQEDVSVALKERGINTKMAPYHE